MCKRIHICTLVKNSADIFWSEHICPKISVIFLHLQKLCTHTRARTHAHTRMNIHPCKCACIYTHSVSIYVIGFVIENFVIIQHHIESIINRMNYGQFSQYANRIRLHESELNPKLQACWTRYRNFSLCCSFNMNEKKTDSQTMWWTFINIVLESWNTKVRSLFAAVAPALITVSTMAQQFIQTVYCMQILLFDVNRKVIWWWCGGGRYKNEWKL
jgi:hypothetical protein